MVRYLRNRVIDKEDAYKDITLGDYKSLLDAGILHWAGTVGSTNKGGDFRLALNNLKTLAYASHVLELSDRNVDKDLPVHLTALRTLETQIHKELALIGDTDERTKRVQNKIMAGLEKAVIIDRHGQGAKATTS